VRRDRRSREIIDPSSPCANLRQPDPAQPRLGREWRSPADTPVEAEVYPNAVTPSSTFLGSFIPHPSHLHLHLLRLHLHLLLCLPAHLPPISSLFVFLIFLLFFQPSPSSCSPSLFTHKVVASISSEKHNKSRASLPALDS